MKKLCRDCKKFKSYNVGNGFDENYCSGKQPHLPPNKCDEWGIPESL